MAANEINTSLGNPGRPEERTFDRLYQTLDRPVNDYLDLLHEYTQLRLLNKQKSHRRVVLKCLCPGDVIDRAVNDDRLRVEAVIPMNLVMGTNDDSAIAFLAVNFHDSPLQGEDPKEFITHRKNGRRPVEKVQGTIDKGFALSNSLNEKDYQDLHSLWQRFGWTQKEITNFIRRIRSNEKNLWFSGIRNPEGKLVAACNAEAVDFAGIKYIETTEYSTLDGFEGQGLCTASVAGLVSQILETTKDSENVPVITAEFNTSSTSASIGASVGFVIPEVKGVSQILSCNVGVVDGSDPNPVFRDSHEKDRGIPFRFLRDFAVAVLSRENIANLYPQHEIDQIISLYNKS